MSRTSTVARACSRFMLVAAFAISAAALGGCAETTSGVAAAPVQMRVAGNAYRLSPSLVEVRNDTGARPAVAIASRPPSGHSDRASRSAH